MPLASGRNNLTLLLSVQSRTLNMNWKSAIYQSLINTDMEAWIAHLMPQLDAWENAARHGDSEKWQQQLKQLPDLIPDNIELKKAVKFDLDLPLSAGHQSHIKSVLKQFMPWRKGPFSLFGINIDTEWRSDWKWDRVVQHIEPLEGKKVLDVGCGSGYHLFRMFGENAELVVGIDPTELFFYQFRIFKKYLAESPIHYLPLGIEDMPSQNNFGTVFSMGVLYHRRDPIEFLYQLKSQLRSGGQLVLETIVVDGDVNTVLMPGERYAQMRNVWFLPSNLALKQWLGRVGFTDIRLVDENVTSCEEQRATEWMTNHSLSDFLDPNDNRLTIEGYPAPTRSVFVARKK